jgi:hypothetical protein
LAAWSFTGERLESGCRGARGLTCGGGAAVVSLAERHGKTVLPLVLTSNDSLVAIARTAQELDATEINLGRSAKFSPDFQAESFALRWGQVEPDAEREMVVRVISEHEDLRVAF